MNIKEMNTNELKFSVITPVYNAAEFVTRAVESALAQPEVAEVLLVEDNSPDNSLEICLKLAQKDERVRVLRHPDGGNHGAGASRNLGMKNASCDFVAFVDADNFFLPNRFAKTKDVISSNRDCEGVYEAIGIHIENEASLKRWQESNRHPVDKLITLSKPIEPGQLGVSLISGAYGSLTLDGFVIKKSILDRSGIMAESLRLHQDTEWIIRCALVTKLYPGNLDAAVAMEGVHEQNRFSAPRSKVEEYHNRMMFWLSLYHWSKQHTSVEIQKLILERIIAYTESHKYFKKFPRKNIPTRLITFTRLLRLVEYPDILRDKFLKKK